MKKAFLLSLLLVVAASAAITFPGGAPSKVGVDVVINVPGSGTALLYVNDGSADRKWVSPTSITMGQDTTVQITRPGNGLKLVAKGATNEESATFNVATGDPYTWQIIAPGQTADPGNPDNPKGKTGSGSVIAGVVYYYDVNVCDKWFNVTNANPTGFEIDSDDPFEHVDGDSVELRRIYGSSGSTNRTVTVSGGSYENDESTVNVKVNSPAALLIICPGETWNPGDTSTTSNPGKQDTLQKAKVGENYIVDVLAVDMCWNQVNTYNSSEVNVYGSIQGNLTGSTVDPITGGKADSVKVVFKATNTAGELISASDGTLSTGPDTRVIVSGDVDSLYPFFTPDSLSTEVTSTLTVEAYVGGQPAGSDIAIAVKFLSLPEESEVTLPETIKTQADPLGVATTTLKPDEEGTYKVEVSVGAVKKTATLVVKDLDELVIYPNPFRASATQTTINFKYEVPDAGADEVTLLVVDPFGNTAYKAVYTSGDELNPGYQTIYWDGKNGKGVKVASGLYQAVLRVKSGLETEDYPKNFMVIW